MHLKTSYIPIHTYTYIRIPCIPMHTHTYPYTRPSNRVGCVFAGSLSIGRSRPMYIELDDWSSTVDSDQFPKKTRFTT